MISSWLLQNRPSFLLSPSMKHKPCPSQKQCLAQHITVSSTTGRAPPGVRPPPQHTQQQKQRCSGCPQAPYPNLLSGSCCSATILVLLKLRRERAEAEQFLTLLWPCLTPRLLPQSLSGSWCCAAYGSCCTHHPGLQWCPHCRGHPDPAAPHGLQHITDRQQQQDMHAATQGETADCALSVS